MTHLPSNTAAMIFLAVFLCLGMTERSWGCSDCVCATDNTCSNDMCANTPNANCTRHEFTAACTGTYTFYVETTCVDDLCSGCQTCASVWKVTGGPEVFLAQCETNGCNVTVCNQSCSVSLIQGASYVLYVCKVYCPGGADDCEDCKASCNAVACLSNGAYGTPCTP